MEDKPAQRKIRGSAGIRSGVRAEQPCTGMRVNPHRLSHKSAHPKGRSEGIVGKNYIDIENDHGETLRYRKHVNGRGLVAHGAKVHPSALVENGAYVEPGVQIAAGVRVGRGAWIESDAVIGPEARIEPHAHICAGAVIGAGAHIGVRTQVGSNARVAVGSLIGDDEIINDGEAVATDRRGLRLAA